MPSQTKRAKPACAPMVAEGGGPAMKDAQQPMTLSGWPGEAEPRSDPSRDRFRHNLSRIMAERNLTQAGLARTMHVSRVAVHAWIWGTCFPETSRLIRLAQTLNVPIGMLLEGVHLFHSGGLTCVRHTPEDIATTLEAFEKVVGRMKNEGDFNGL